MRLVVAMLDYNHSHEPLDPYLMGLSHTRKDMWTVAIKNILAYNNNWPK
jgi:hypothetical protein